MFDDNEVIIKDWNKIRFSSDIFIPDDVFINFYSLVIVINYVIKKMMNLFQKFILMKDILKKMNKVRELKIDCTLWSTPAKLVNLLDFKPEKLSIKTENDESSTIITHQVRYENGGFYLTIDNIKGYFSFIDNNVVLDMIFLMMIKKINIIKYGKEFL